MEATSSGHPKTTGTKKKKKEIYNPGQSGLDCVTVGGGTRCSSILLDWERRMRLKKSSSGTVGPAGVADGAAHLWSSSLEPWNGVKALATKSTLELAHVNLFFLSHLTFYKHVKKHIIALRLLSFTVLGRRVYAGGRGCVEKWDQLQSERSSKQLKQLKWADLLGGLDLCWRWSVYEAGWRCWDVSQENGSGWLVGRPGDGPESWPAAPGNDQDPAMVFRAPK